MKNDLSTEPIHRPLGYKKPLLLGYKKAPVKGLHFCVVLQDLATLALRIWQVSGIQIGLSPISNDA